MIKYFDIFAGIGGFRSGIEKAGGFECVGYCEIDKYAKKAYETLYDTRNEVYYDDARKIDPNELPDLDLICGGFPCQSFSIAGKRKGFSDTRGTLFFEIARIAAIKKPKYLLLENVPGLLSHNCLSFARRAGRLRPSSVRWMIALALHGRYDVVWEVLNSADFNVAQSRKRVYIIGFHREKCSGKVLSFTDANPKTLVKRISGREGNRVYSADGLSITLTSQAGGFGGKTGLYEIIGLPIKSKTKSGYQIALPGDSIDLAYPNMNSRRGRVGKEIAHTLTTSCNQGYYALGIDMNPEPKVTELARCITARQDSGIGHHKGEKSGVVLITDPIAVLTPEKEKVRQQGRRFKLPNEPMFTLTVTDRHGVVYCGYIRKLMPLECWRLQGFTDEQFERVKATGMSDAQLYKQAGNAVTTNVIEALAKFILEIDKENANGTDNQNI